MKLPEMDAVEKFNEGSNYNRFRFSMYKQSSECELKIEQR